MTQKSWFVQEGISKRCAFMRNRAKKNRCLARKHSKYDTKGQNKQIKLDFWHCVSSNVPVQLWRSYENLTSFIRIEKITWTDDVVPQCRYVTLASTSVIKASVSTTKDQAAKSRVAMVTAVLAAHLTRDRLLMSLLLKGSPTHSQALSGTQLFLCSFLK